MKPNRYFWRFIAVMAFFFLGGVTDIDFFATIGVSLFTFFLGHSLIKRRANPNNRLPYTGFLVVFSALIPLADVSDFFGSLLGFTALAWGGYAVTSRFIPQFRQAKLTGQGHQQLGGASRQQSRVNPIITDLQAAIRQLDADIQTLNHYREQHQLADYKNLAKDILPRLKAVKDALHDHKDLLDEATYDRLTDRIRLETKLMTRQLKAYGLADDENHSDVLNDVKRLAPELLDTVTAVQTDSAAIRTLIAHHQSGNQAELLELHETNSRRFDTILAGYLKIKQAPQHYYDADQRLAIAQTTMIRFEENLKEQLRQLNENDMHEFEVNLRLLNNYS